MATMPPAAKAGAASPGMPLYIDTNCILPKKAMERVPEIEKVVGD